MQVAKLEEWHPSLHVFAESLSGSVESTTIITAGPGMGTASQNYPGKHVGTADITFNGIPPPHPHPPLSSFFPLPPWVFRRYRGNPTINVAL